MSTRIPALKRSLREAYIDETQINLNAVKHGSEGSHEDCKASNTVMPCAEDLSIRGFGIDVLEGGS
jgi:hypothetical protein